MTEEIHITIGIDDKVLEADCEVTATRVGRGWDLEDFRYEDIVVTENGESESLDEMPDEFKELADDECERTFLKLDL